MKKQLSKILAVILSTAFAATGCGRQTAAGVPTSQVLDVTPASSVTTSVFPTQTPDLTDTLPNAIPAGTEINYWHPWSGEMANLVSELTSEFNTTNDWGITVNTEFHSDETVLIADLNQAFIEGNAPELIAAPEYYLRLLEDSGVSLWNLTEFIASPAWGYSRKESADFLPIFWNSGVVEDKRLSVPAYRSASLIFYNQTWARELGFPNAPSNPEEFQSRTCAAGLSYLNDRDLDNNGTGGWVYSYDPYTFLSWLQAFDGGIAPGENPLVLEENTAAGSFLYNLFLNDCAWIGRQLQPYGYFANRQALAYSGLMEDILTQERVNKLNESDDLWSVLPYPGESSELIIVDGFSYAIAAKDTETALAAWVFIQWMLNPENQVKIIETTGTLPLSTTATGMLNDFKLQHPVWADALGYLPFVQNAPTESYWGTAKKIFADISWKLIQYTTAKDDIPFIFLDAQTLLKELS